MRRPRPYMYLYQTEEETLRYLSGVEFEEFMGAHGPTNLVLVKHQYGRPDPHPHTGFVVIEPGEFGALFADDPYQYGDFHLLDVPDLGALDSLSKQEIAEVLYLSHRWEPLSTPFLPGLGNSFAYLAHDDGWFAKLFFRDTQRFYAIFGEVLRNRIERFHRRRLPPFPAYVESTLWDWAAQGLYIDLKDVAKSRDEFTLHAYRIGADRAPYSPGSPPTGIDAVTNDSDAYKRTSLRGLLRCHRRRWTVEESQS